MHSESNQLPELKDDTSFRLWLDSDYIEEGEKGGGEGYTLAWLPELPVKRALEGEPS